VRRVWLALASALIFAALPGLAAADTLPTGERGHGSVTIEPAYDDFNGSIIYLQTPNRLAPLNPTQPINGVNPHAVAPLFLIVYPPGTPGTFNCMGNPGNCPDHDGAIAGVATLVEPGVYGSDPLAIPGHDHLVGNRHTGDYNTAWHVYVELFTSNAAVTHITTLSGLQSGWSSGAVIQLDSGITFLCPIVPASLYEKGTPVG
jgi:hypothetical protein